MAKMVGIDLGTTNTVVAVMDGPRPRVLDSREGKPQIRSVVGLKRKRGKKDEAAVEEVLVGDAAVDNWGFAPRDTIVSIKRLMGRGVNDEEVQRVSQWAQFKVVPPSNGTRDSVRVLIGSKEYSPIEVSAMILKKAKEDAEFRLGEPVTHAVITVPAYFSQIQRDATRKAGLKAGLNVIKVLDEPTAAAIAFGTDSGDGTPKTVLVFDLGGGTFDVSLLMVAGSIFAPLNLEGDMWLGGDNLDQVLVDHALKYVQDEYGIDGTTDHRFMAELRKAAMAVKERLSASGSAYLVLSSMLKDDDGNLLDVDIEIKRDQYERMILPLVARYRECSCGQANYPEDDRCAKCNKGLSGAVKDGKTIQIVKRTLEEKNQTVDMIDHVLMAGNSTAVPLVQKSIEEMFGKDKVVRKIHPKHSVALGAAIQAAWIGDHIVCHAADAADASRECGHVNEPSAAKCANCGAKLGLDEAADDAPGGTESIQIEIGGAARGDERPRRAAGGEVGGIAAMNYGTQSAGDTFNIFVHKGDPYPTDEPKTSIFYTRIPNQRMVSIPIYGGAHLDKASRNERQGQAFAILPRGLPQDTPVRVKLWLDGDGVFGLSVYLENGVDLDPWIVTGEGDARAIEGIQRIDQAIAKNAEAIAPDAMERLEEGRDKVFRKMKDRDFDAAVKQVEALEKDASNAATEQQRGGIRQAVENGASYLEFIIHQYSWVISDPNLIYSLNKLIEDVRDDLGRADEATLKKRLAALEAAMERLPETVIVFLTLKGVILSRIHPYDPATAAALMQEVDSLEEAVKRNDPAIQAKLKSLTDKIQRSIPKPPEGFKCWNCGFSTQERFCPKCNSDLWILGGKISSSGSFTSK